MKPFTNKYLIVFLLVFVNCVSNNKTNVESTKESKVKIEKDLDTSFVLTFINDYVTNSNTVNTPVLKWLSEYQNVTNDLIYRLERMIDSAYQIEPEIGLDFDPIFNAQDYPEEGFMIDSINEEANTIIVKGKDWQEFKLPIKLKLVKNQWLIDGVGAINI